MSNATIQSETVTTPDRLLGLGTAFWVSQILSAAAHYKFFTLISKGHRTAEAVAKAAQTDPRGTRMVLDGLAAVGVLEKVRDGYALAPDTDAFLVEGRPADLTPMFDVHTKLVWSKWGEMTEALRNPEKVRQYADLDEAQTFFPKLIRAILPLGLGAADALAEHLGVSRRSCRNQKKSSRAPVSARGTASSRATSWTRTSARMRTTSSSSATCATG